MLDYMYYQKCFTYTFKFLEDFWKTRTWTRRFCSIRAVVPIEGRNNVFYYRLINHAFLWKVKKVSYPQVPIPFVVFLDVLFYYLLIWISKSKNASFWQYRDHFNIVCKKYGVLKKKPRLREYKQQRSKYTRWTLGLNRSTPLHIMFEKVKGHKISIEAGRR